ncbi:proton channel OtopLc-like [Paramacrobiotus metropolitanus]|uniref:proton channel OtopLc-like n=1 Tax=Paramacrobiotus metropolitanus TaxID=2943436 RepID=UPI002445F42E|nr:proton channel OtopLc-like [Paramacrobiotus metropolitanus]
MDIIAGSADAVRSISTTELVHPGYRAARRHCRHQSDPSSSRVQPSEDSGISSNPKPIDSNFCSDRLHDSLKKPGSTGNLHEAYKCENVTINSRTITRLSSKSPESTEREFDNISYGLRVRLGRNLRHSHRNSFANQVEQLSSPFSTLPPFDDQWGAEISQPLSALYSILIIITGACLAFSSQLTSNVDSMYCRYFDSALLSIGIFFLLTSFGFFYRKHSYRHNIGFFNINAKTKDSCDSSSEESVGGSFTGYFRKQFLCISDPACTTIEQTSVRVTYSEEDSASFYLKMGALSFAVGSMIYACLELGVFVENTSCFNTVMGLNPVLFVCFIILQLYFIFLNSRLSLRKNRTIGRFVLMHLISANLCIWLRTLIDETLHAFGKIREKNERMMLINNNETTTQTQIKEDLLQMHDDSLGQGGYNPLCVNDESVMKKMMEEASVFLYPCIIEYSLISAGILYNMWSYVGYPQPSHLQPHRTGGTVKKSYAVDCDQAAKGLFVGIIVVVMTVVSLILYFLFLEKDHYVAMAVFQAQLTEIALYSIGLVAVVYAFINITKNLHRTPVRSTTLTLDDTLLKVSMVGVYAYSISCIIGAYTDETNSGILSIVVASLCLVQSTAQTIFIFDATQRTLIFNPGYTKLYSSPNRKKPARETVTLLLIINFALWATNVLCTLQAESSPSQTEFYGVHQWTVMLHVTVPLVIFYRFHSTACLFEIWKRAYKEKRPALKDHSLAEHVTHV